MVFPDHYLLQFGGDFVSDPSEIWSNTIRFAAPTGGGGGIPPGLTNATQQTLSSAFAGILTTHMGDINSRRPSNTRMKYVKFNRINAQGGYADPGVTNATFQAGAGAAGGSTTSLPLTSALVITWRTTVDRGPASRGRIFVPQPSITLNTATYRLAPTDATATATAYRTLLLNLNAAVESAAPGGPKAAVVSEVPAEGVARAITRVEVGNFLDYMGSRRNNLTELRVQSAPLT